LTAHEPRVNAISLAMTLKSGSTLPPLAVSAVMLGIFL
jgi:hypothetical protein